MLTSRSSSFEMTDRLEIGLNNLGSAGSRSAFFSNGFDCILNVYRESLYTFNMQSNTSNTTVTKTELKITS